MNRITLKQLAEELNISKGSVSKALSNSHEISTETKARVQELAKKLNYIPNAYAGSLRGLKSRTIAMVIPEVADSYFAQAINGVELIARQKGYHVLIYLTHESVEREQAILKDFEGGRVDGVLISLSAETTDTAHIHALQTGRTIPVIFFDRVCEDYKTTKITTNDLESAYRATSHLISAGCRNIALLSISNSLSISNKRREGYLQALEDNEMIVSPDHQLTCPHQGQESFKAIRQLLQGPSRPDGIVATVERLTVDVYLACQELGLRIPEDLKIISFSNFQHPQLLNPPLTTITQPAHEMGKKAASLLIKALEKSHVQLEHECLELPAVLIRRRSTQLF